MEYLEDIYALSYWGGKQNKNNPKQKGKHFPEHTVPSLSHKQACADIRHDNGVYGIIYSM